MFYDYVVLEDGAPGADMRAEALTQARRLYADGMARLGIDPSAVNADSAHAASADEELYLDALAARMSERGTW